MVQRFSNFSVHPNPRVAMFKQIAGPTPRVPDQEVQVQVGGDNLRFSQVLPRCRNYTWKTTALLC